MEYRILGRTGLRVSALALGTVELGLDYGIAAPGHFGRPAEAEAIRLVHSALDAGINLIDTARDYGESEAILGKAIADRRARVALATKVNTRHAGASPQAADLRRSMLASLETSLRLLHTDAVDLWYIHNLDEQVLAQIDVIAEVFAEVRRKGWVRWVGGSCYGAEIPLKALATDVFDVLQVTYSLLDQRLVDHVFPTAQQQNIGIVVRSILLKGALTERGDHLPDRLAVLRARSQQFRRLVAASGLALQPAQAALAFGLAQAQIGAVLVGVRTEQELQEDLQALETKLPPDFLAQLQALRLDDADLLNPGTWGIP